jgi:hypothetical protein
MVISRGEIDKRTEMVIPRGWIDNKRMKQSIWNKLVLHLHRDNQLQQIFTLYNENKAIQIQDY